MSPGAYLLQGDARQIPLADGSVQCVVTSPPYWGLRDYGMDGQLGLEKTPEEYVAHLVDVFREVRRVLRVDGTCWVNLGDSYASDIKGSGGTGKSTLCMDGRPEEGRQRTVLVAQLTQQMRPRQFEHGLKPKDLVGIPWRVAFALQADGWWLRSDIIWSKPNPMPESITDRPTKAHEYLFLFSKAARYFYDAEAIKEPTAYGPRLCVEGAGNHTRFDAANDMRIRPRHSIQVGEGRNRRSVWTIATEPYPEAHFATFPEKLVEPCILAGTSERGACPTCGAPWGREVERQSVRALADAAGTWAERPAAAGYGQAAMTTQRRDKTSGLSASNSHTAATPQSPAILTTGWAPTCACPPADPVPCRVFDPFVGSGTTVAVAERLGRVGIGLELKPSYLALARRRTVQMGLL